MYPTESNRISVSGQHSSLTGLEEVESEEEFSDDDFPPPQNTQEIQTMVTQYFESSDEGEEEQILD